jgi:serine protease Do
MKAMKQGFENSSRGRRRRVSAGLAGAAVVLAAVVLFCISRHPTRTQALRPAPGLASQGAAASESPSPQDLAALQSSERALVAIVEKLKPTVVTIRSEIVSSAAQQEEEEPNPLQPFEDLPWPFPQFKPSPRMPPTPPRQGSGSGVIIDPSGIVLTAAHVVQDAKRLRVILDNGDELRAEVVAADPIPGSDLAIVKIRGAKALPAAKLGDASELKPGSWAIAIGAPFSIFEGSVTFGHVSAVGRVFTGVTPSGRSMRNLIQTDAAINRGNSGGPLANIKGEVVGICNSIWSETGGNIGIGFAVAINQETRKVIAGLRQGRVPERGLLGVKIKALGEGDRKVWGVEKGALVTQIIPHSAAAAAKIQPEDIIVAFGDTPVKDPDDLVAAVEQTAPGAEVTVTLIREGKRVKVPVKLGKFEAESRPRPQPKTAGLLGLKVEGITPDLAKQYELPSDVEGVVVTDADAQGDAFRAGIREGDLIVKINRLAIKSTADYERTTAGLKKGEPVFIAFYRKDERLSLSIDALGE